MSSELVQYSNKSFVKCGRWDASFRLLATPLPTVHKTCKSVDFDDFEFASHVYMYSRSNEQKQAKRLIHVPFFNTVNEIYVFYDN